MIIYENNALNFRNDVDRNRIVDILSDNFKVKIGYVPEREIDSWFNSLRAMETVIRNSSISDDCGILIEYKVPLTSKRIDFVVAGESEESVKNFIIIELKQWTDAECTDKDGLVSTYFTGGLHETTHPSYQAQSYKFLIREYNENVLIKDIKLFSCAYLHNYKERYPEPLLASQYSRLCSDTPLYFKDDAEKLQRFLKKQVGNGKRMEILYDIRKGKIRPSKKLIECVSSMFEGNSEFILIDKQKVAYENAVSLASSTDEKTVLVVKGGPGTGKSVISVNLLGGLLQMKKNVVFVAPNAAFRDVMIEKLSKGRTKTMLRNLFKGSAGFLDLDENVYDIAIVDEAHRLKNCKAYQYYGENQIEDIVHSARCSIMFVDDIQQIRPDDLGSVSEIKKVARKEKAVYREIELETQFRCSGAAGYINWLDNVLQIRETANISGWDGDFDFRIFDDPIELLKEIRKKNSAGFNARMLAGYAWKWTSKKDGNPNGEVDDVIIDEFDFSMPWNSRSSRTTWAIDDRGVEQIGCIHTAQGLEFDYVGVIIGNDLRFDPKKNEYYVDWKSYKDPAGKKGLKKQPDKLSEYVRNIYKVLMSRGIKGCYVYICNEEVKRHFYNRLDDPSLADSCKNDETEKFKELIPHQNALPLINLRSVASSYFENIEGYIPFDDGSYELFPVENGPFPKDRFLVRVEGDSMEPDIPGKSICRFRLDPGGTRNGKIVLCIIEDKATGSDIGVIKRYYSERDEFGVAQHIVLSSSNSEHQPIVLTEEDQARILGVFEEIIIEG